MRHSCCGGYVNRKAVKPTPIKPNPVVKGGVGLIYLGAGNFQVRGAHSGETYYASDHFRHFRVFREDADQLLKDARLILAT